ncbi:trypsin-like peptidase domain-containing protein [Amycolatopsis sp. GM8]|uniref:trypsin-like peptidase domain-containing protein n=1 Tax=Amycolatopsis sp. GM8 TaxID=2896530 RepID=UPI001F483656|nr:trypsin-like peptidase domain-containing protein [Amycolatopsis sp. GM8]
MTENTRVQGYLGRIVTPGGEVAGTCFQIAPGLLVTARHVIAELPGPGLAVEALDGSGARGDVRVVRVDEVHDLALLQGNVPLPDHVRRWLASDGVPLNTEVVVTGVSRVEDGDRDYRYLDAPGTWAGGTTRDGEVALGRFSSRDVVLGMSGAPVRRVADDRVVGVVSARYNSADGWLAGTVWVARTEDLRSLLEDLRSEPDAQPVEWDELGELLDLPRTAALPGGARVKPLTALLAVVAAIVIAVAVTLVVLRPGGDVAAPSTPVRSSANASPVPADPATPPVLVENVTALRSNAGDGSFVLPEPLVMSPAELARFNQEVSPSTRDWWSWYGERGGAALGSGLTTITLRGNTSETVRIVDLKAVKQCGPPFDGTYFQGYSQGTGDNITIGFDLDESDPSAQEMAYTSGRGLFPTGDHFFDRKTVTLAPGEVETITVGAFTSTRSCTFGLQLVVATAAGSFTQDITDAGKPFVVSAMAPPAVAGQPLSGYRQAYRLEEGREWVRAG